MHFHKNITQHLFLYFVLNLYMRGETFVKNIKKKKKLWITLQPQTFGQ